jgi:tetratricopeptide (TPR) repeat protein
MTFPSWLTNAGTLRAWLLALGLVLWVPYVVLDPAFFISKHPLVLPPLILLILDAVRSICSSIILVECIRLLVPRWTQTTLKVYFITVLAVLVIIIGVKVATAHTTATRYYSYAWSLSDHQRYGEALRSLDIAVTYNPGHTKAYLEKAYVHRRLGNYDLALVDCNKAIGMAPNDPIVYVSRGQSHYYLGQYRQALSDFEKAISLGYSGPESLERWMNAAKKNL